MAERSPRRSALRVTPISQAQATFIASVGKLAELPREDLPEIVFAGRSNVGKSSAINALTNRRRLAFTSKTPGRTQTINFYELGGRARLVDLPGYGYARVPSEIRDAWRPLIEAYLSGTRELKGVVQLIDIRHELRAEDRRMIEYLADLGVPTLIVLTKADKIGRTHREAQRNELVRALDVDPEQILAVSATTGEGCADLTESLEHLLTGDRS